MLTFSLNKRSQDALTKFITVYNEDIKEDKNYSLVSDMLLSELKKAEFIEEKEVHDPFAEKMEDLKFRINLGKDISEVYDYDIVSDTNVLGDFEQSDDRLLEGYFEKVLSDFDLIGDLQVEYGFSLPYRMQEASRMNIIIQTNNYGSITTGDYLFKFMQELDSECGRAEFRIFLKVLTKQSQKYLEEVLQ